MTELCRTLLADCPWQHDQRVTNDKHWGTTSNHYATMPVEEIKAFPIPDMHRDSWLFLWRVASMQQEAFDVAKAWGFRIVSEIVWVKKAKNDALRIGLGSYVRLAHEVCLIGVRGKASSTRLSKSIPSVWEAQRSEHSSKPEVFYRVIEHLAPGPRVELFARKRRPGWSQFGLELPEQESAVSL